MQNEHACALTRGSGPNTPSLLQTCSVTLLKLNGMEVGNGFKIMSLLKTKWQTGKLKLFWRQLLVPGGIQRNLSHLFSHNYSIQTEWLRLIESTP